MWSQPQTEDAPAPRAAHSCNFIRNSLYIFGGWNGRDALGDLWVLDLKTMIFSRLITEGSIPCARNNHSSVVVGSKLYIHGGHDGSRWLNDLYVLDTITNTWSEVNASGAKPCARACHTISHIGRKLYMFGGFDGTSCFNSVDALDLDTYAWLSPTVYGDIPSPRNAHATAVFGNTLIMNGGHSGNKHLRDLYELNIETMTWSQITRTTGPGPPGLRGHTANVVGNKIFLFGGYDGRDRLNELYVLNLNTMNWDRATPCIDTPGGRQRHTGCLVGSKLYIHGGFDGTKWLPDLHVLNIQSWEEKHIRTDVQDQLICNLKHLLNNKDSFCDIVLKVQDKPIYAHKSILASQCDLFKAMFSSGMKESREEEIMIPEWEYTTFLQMLEFLYTGQVEDLNIEDALNLLRLADHYTLSGLTRLCENVLFHNIHEENVCILFTAAHHYQAPNLKNQCMLYILKHFEFVIQTKGFDDLKSEPQLLMEVTRASINRLNLDS